MLMHILWNYHLKQLLSYLVKCCLACIFNICGILDFAQTKSVNCLPYNFGRCCYLNSFYLSNHFTCLYAPIGIYDAEIRLLYVIQGKFKSVYVFYWENIIKLNLQQWDSMKFIIYINISNHILDLLKVRMILLLIVFLQPFLKI